MCWFVDVNPDWGTDSKRKAGRNIVDATVKIDEQGIQESFDCAEYNSAWMCAQYPTHAILLQWEKMHIS